jgi:hypothetical protein
MDNRDDEASRRVMLAGLGAVIVSVAIAPPAQAQLLGGGIGGGLGGLLGKASDSALGKLSQPRAFYGAPAVRIALPLLEKTSGLGKLAVSAERSAACSARAANWG